MMSTNGSGQNDLDVISAATDQAIRAIPPLWPLASSVAVNPFLGQANEDLAMVSARLARVAGASVTMSRRWYREQIDQGAMSDQDLLDALLSAPVESHQVDIAALKAAIKFDPPRPRAVPTVADLAADASGIDWPDLIAERIGAFAAGYFDEGQALWAAPRQKSLYDAWRSYAMHDLTPEIAGLGRFAVHVSETPGTALAAIARVTGRLGVTADAMPTYFHQMLMSLGGWSQFARYLLWQAELSAESDDTLLAFLAIRLIWEEALYIRYEPQIAVRWREAKAVHARPVEPTADNLVDAILQEAAERAAQRALARTLDIPAIAADDARPSLQVAFCIDVRSEVFRRALERISPDIRTLGFAGFFGLPTSYRRFASDVDELRLPVLLRPALFSCSGGPETAVDDQSTRVKARAKRAWGRFKLAAVSSFAFVEATGPVYVGKLILDALGLHRRPAKSEPAPHLVPALDLSPKINTAETILRAMSLTSGFARLVLLAGHGATVVNNPHASGLQCGACGGYSGEVNARLLASLLNDREVRIGLVPRGIEIPADTLFVGAQHDTTTDEVTLYAADQPSDAHAQDLKLARLWLAKAGKLARSERALRLPRATAWHNLVRRSLDWAETRPEWGLAGCKAFIAAPRKRTAGKTLEGRAFLHDYDWRADTSFSVLELILTAPVVVASWISLQYYGSTVAPDIFGGGNKLLHNVTGGIGVVEGNAGLLKAGLPLQSVHDGKQFIHEPLRLTVCIEAPREAMSEILARNSTVRDLFDHRWLHLFALDADGRMAWRYVGDLGWEANDASAPHIEQRALRQAAS